MLNSQINIENSEDSKKFKNLLKDLSNKKIEDKFEDFIIKIKEIYSDENGNVVDKHFYADIFHQLTSIEEIEKDVPEALDNVGYNIIKIKDFYLTQADKVIDFANILIKLADYINLDIARINYTNLIRNDVGELKQNAKDTLSNLTKKDAKLNKTVKQISELKKEYETLKSNQDYLVDDLKSAKTEYISILGIFSSVVLAFTGALAFSTAVLDNVYRTPLAKLLTVASLVALFFFIIIYVMFGFIRFIKKSGQVELYKDNNKKESQDEGKSNKKQRFNELFHWDKGLFWSGVIIFGVIFLFSIITFFKTNKDNVEPESEEAKIENTTVVNVVDEMNKQVQKLDKSLIFEESTPDSSAD